MPKLATEAPTNVILFPRFKLCRGVAAVQINCKECGGKATINARKTLDVKVSQLYCSCKDAECGHTFVMDLCYSHSLSPSSRQAKNMVIDFMRALPEAERQLMLANM